MLPDSRPLATVGADFQGGGVAITVLDAKPAHEPKLDIGKVCAIEGGCSEV